VFDAGAGGGNHHVSLLMPTTTLPPLRHVFSGKFGLPGPVPLPTVQFGKLPQLWAGLFAAPGKLLYVQLYVSPPGLVGWLSQSVEPAGHSCWQTPAVQFVKYVANVDRPKFTSPENAWTVCRNAHLASFSRVGRRPHEFNVAEVGHVAGNWYVPVDGFVQPIIDPDVSTASMKYGREGAGQSAGFEDKHTGSSCALAGCTPAAIAAKPESTAAEANKPFEGRRKKAIKCSAWKRAMRPDMDPRLPESAELGPRPKIS
jgi:hypothetical protein